MNIKYWRVMYRRNFKRPLDFMASCIGLLLLFPVGMWGYPVSLPCRRGTNSSTDCQPHPGHSQASRPARPLPWQVHLWYGGRWHWRPDLTWVLGENKQYCKQKAIDNTQYDKCIYNILLKYPCNSAFLFTTTNPKPKSQNMLPKY